MLAVGCTLLLCSIAWVVKFLLVDRDLLFMFFVRVLLIFHFLIDGRLDEPGRLIVDFGAIDSLHIDKFHDLSCLTLGGLAQDILQAEVALAVLSDVIHLRHWHFFLLVSPKVSIVLVCMLAIDALAEVLGLAYQVFRLVDRLLKAGSFFVVSSDYAIDSLAL